MVRFLRQDRDLVILVQKLELDPGTYRPYPQPRHNRHPSVKEFCTVREMHPYGGFGISRELDSYLLPQCKWTDEETGLLILNRKNIKTTTKSSICCNASCSTIVPTDYRQWLYFIISLYTRITVLMLWLKSLISTAVLRIRIRIRIRIHRIHMFLGLPDPDP
jgi:hypothetical protein